MKSSLPPGFAEQPRYTAVRVYGAERIVCGTDGSAFGVDWTRKALEEAEIGAEAREAILHRNAAAIMARALQRAWLEQRLPSDGGFR